MASEPTVLFAGLLANPDRLLSNEEIAEIAQVPLSSVRKWPSEGKGPRRFRLGKYVRYRAGDVRDWLLTHSVD
jgi:predicted DNA-binding transcriptional regulator AlpA